MKQALEIIGDLIKTHKEKPTLDLGEFDQGINEGLILARRALLNAKGASQSGTSSDQNISDFNRFDDKFKNGEPKPFL